MSSSSKKKKHPAVKSRLHPRNLHRERYDFAALIKSYPDLKNFVSENKYGDDSVDFFDPRAVKALNKALLLHFYGLDYWDIPKDFLCPPIPGRADYLHYVADLLSSSNFGRIPKGAAIKGLDIGVGANCVYPIIGHQSYGWSFVGSDVDPVAVASALNIVESNKSLFEHIHIQLQEDSSQILETILHPEHPVDFTMCNPPFHASLEASQEGTLRKLSNLKNKKITKSELNFGGHGGELWTKGGEKKFILDMIQESTLFAKSCCWFTTLVSKQSHLKHFYSALDKTGVRTYKTIAMGQGNKVSRILAWTFLSKEEEQKWVKNKWKQS